MHRSDGSSSDLNILRACNVVSAYVANNAVPASEIPSLINNVYAALERLGACDVCTLIGVIPVARPTAADVHRSVGHDGIVSFIDGKTYKILKRHLTAYGLHPQSYRERYGLPADYPMVAPGYSERRSTLARGFTTQPNRSKRMQHHLVRTTPV
ncbi:MucR family transcriptional regulator [Methylobacterium sp. J-077]|nr:MucR family transcriptional regulator [Methylobacterium sp. J-077]